MYQVIKETHSKYNNIISITITEDGDCETPFQAYLKAKKLRRLWMEEGQKKVRCFVDNQVMTIDQVEVWAYAEYKRLPKCAGCARILFGEVYTNKLCHGYLFCSTACSDKEFTFQSKKIEEDETDSF